MSKLRKILSVITIIVITADITLRLYKYMEENK